MAKKKPDQPNPEEQALEERIREMMEPENQAASADSAAKKKPLSIKIIHDEEEDKDVAAAIEEANEQLRAATAPELGDDKAKKPLKVVPIVHDDTEEAAAEEPAATDEPSADEAVEETKTEEPQETTAPEIPDEPPVVEPIEAEEATEDKTEEEVEPAEETPTEPEAEPEEEELPEAEPDEETNKVVDEIIAEESDQVLEAEDREREIAEVPKRPKTGLGTRLRRFFGNRIVRGIILLLLLGGILAAGVVPTSRYYVLNTAGVRSSTSLLVMDESTQQPLKNVKVTVDGQSGVTGDDGRVSIGGLRMGEQQIKFERHAFAELTKTHIFGWGSNPLGDFKLTPTGTQYSFMITDYVSGKPIAKVEASSADASAFSDEKGAIKLATDRKDDSDFEVEIKAEGYRSEKLTIKAGDTAEKSVNLVLSRKHVFVSKRSGKYDVYKVDIDGKNEERILAGTGTERDDIVVVPHPTAEVVAVVSSRDNKRNKDGFLLSTLTVIDLKSNATKSVTVSERLHVVDWIGSRLVYVQVAEGESTSSPKRHRLMSYEYKEESTKELAASNFFNDVVVAQGKIYYAPSSAYQENAEIGLFRLEADGSGKQAITTKETWNIFRTSYEHLVLAMPQAWYDYRLGEKAPLKLEGAPANQTTRIYVDTPDGKHSIWVDQRDGKGVLVYYDLVGKTDNVIRTQSGIKYPVRWLDNTHLVFRINTEDETADFALSIEGGEAKKIKDVTDTDGVDAWYYY